jgi:hypothetical protein
MNPSDTSWVEIETGIEGDSMSGREVLPHLDGDEPLVLCEWDFECIATDGICGVY